MCPFSFWSALSSMYILRPSLSRLSRGGFGFNFDCLFSLDCFSLRSWLLSYKGKRKRKRKEKKDKQWAREKGQGRGKGKGNDRQDRQKETETEEKPPTEATKSQRKPPKANRSHQKFTERVGTLIGICVLRLIGIFFWWSVRFSMGKALQSRDFV